MNIKLKAIEYCLVVLFVVFYNSLFAQNFEIEDITTSFSKNCIRVEFINDVVSDDAISVQIINKSNKKERMPYSPKVIKTDGDENRGVCYFKIVDDKDDLFEIGRENCLVLTIKQGNQRIDSVWYDSRPNGLWILAVGTGEKQCEEKSSTPNLMYSAQGTEKFYEKLVGLSKNAYDIKSCDLIINEAANASGIKNRIDFINDNVKNKDLVVIYLSGHGKVSSEKGIDKNQFYFQVKQKNEDSEYCDGDWIGCVFWDKIGEIAKKGARVWFFVNACNAHELINYFPDSEQNPQFYSDWSGGIAFIPGDEKESGNANEDEDKESTRYSYYLCKALIVEEKEEFLRLKDIIGCLHQDYSNAYNIDLYRDDDRGNINSKSELLYLVKRVKREGNCYDFSFGFNFSKQVVLQMGYSIKKWSLFADLSGFNKCTDSISYLVDGHEVEIKKLPSDKVVGIGLGFRWYPLDKMDFLGFGLSAQAGGFSSKMVVSDNPINVISNDDQYVQDSNKKKSWRNYFCITPIVSIRLPAFAIGKRMCRVHANVGYAFYISKLGKDAPNLSRELDGVPVVFNLGFFISNNKY